MAQKFYGSVNGLSDTISKIYGSANGLSKNVVKGYCSENGLSKLFFGNSVVENFWFYYKTENNDVVITNTSWQWKKFQNGITFYTMVSNRDYYADAYWILVLSTDSYGIQVGVTNYLHESGTITRGDDTWYWGICNNTTQKSDDNQPQGCIINPPYADYNTMKTQGISDLLDRIYANDFAEDYQVGQRYNLVVGDIEKTIRKFLAVYHFRNGLYLKTGNTAQAYAKFCQSTEQIVYYILGQAGSLNIIELGSDKTEDNNGIRIVAYLGSSNLQNVLIESRDDDEFGYANCSCDYEVTYTKWVNIDFNSDGTISYSNGQTSFDDYLYLGLGGDGSTYLNWNNAGLNYTNSPKYKYKFHENYQNGQIYSYYVCDFTIYMNFIINQLISFLTSQELTSLAIDIINNKEDILDYFLTNPPTYKEILFGYTRQTTGVTISVVYYTQEGTIRPKSNKTTLNGFDYYENNGYTSQSVTCRFYDFHGDGTITKSSETQSNNGARYLGIQARTSINQTTQFVTVVFSSSNVGIEIYM